MFVVRQHSPNSSDAENQPDGNQVAELKTRRLGLYAEFPEFTRKQIKFFQEQFTRFDEDGDNFISFDELKRMMEKLGEAQTHLALKDIISKVDEDKDGKVSMREFLLVFRLAAKGEISCASVLNELAGSIDVAAEGVKKAADFFQAKIAEANKLSAFEEEIKAEKEEREAAEKERKERRAKFEQSRSLFK